MRDDLEKWFSPEEIAKLDQLYADADQQGWSEYIQTRSDYQALLEGCYFDPEKAQRFADFGEKFVIQVNGKWKGKPFQLFEWQRKSLTDPLFGWLKPNGKRRFSRSYVTVPKKSGKSGLSAVIQLYMLMADGETGANCYCAATDKKQAKLVWGEAVKYLEASPLLKEKVKVFKGTSTVTYEAKFSALRALSADKDSAEGIDAHCCVFDELHMQQTHGMYDILKFSGAAREQPLFLVITTAGESLESVCGKEYSYAKKVICGDVLDTGYLPVIFEAPMELPPGDPETWRIANPSLGLTIDEEELAQAFKQAVETGRLANFRRRRLNQWVKNENIWVSREDFDKCKGEFPDTRERRNLFGRLPFWMGLDLASTEDINALACLWKDDDQFFCRVKFWCPEDSIRIKSQTTSIPYQQWVEEGWLVSTEGSTTDYSLIEEAIIELAMGNKTQCLAFDPWQAEQLAQRLDVAGVPVVKVPQVISQLSPAVKQLESLIRKRKLVHDGNPVLSWMLENIKTKSDPNQNLRFDKAKSKDKIDGWAALCTAMARAMMHEQEADLYGGVGFAIL